MLRLPLCLALLLPRPCLCHHPFHSRDHVVSAVIQTCLDQIPQEREQCYFILRCILDGVPSEYTARWSAGASILSFIPTIVGLMSNSIHEITLIADESLVLAVALCLCSITTFNSRFGNRPKHLADFMFEEQRSGGVHTRKAVSFIDEKIAQCREPCPWWRSSKIHAYVLSVVAVAVGVGVWYEVYEVTRYGILVFACPIKINIATWVGLSQILALLNVLCRSYLFDVHTIDVKTGDVRRRTDSAAGTGAGPVSIILRCPRNTTSGWLLQVLTTIASFVLYAYGTILLASMTLIPASDAIRTMVISTISAGFSRLTGSWFASPGRRYSQIIVVDVPDGSLQDFTTAILAHADVTT